MQRVSAGCRVIDSHAYREMTMTRVTVHVVGLTAAGTIPRDG